MPEPWSRRYNKQRLPQVPSLHSLTPAQTRLLLQCQERWWHLLLATERVDLNRMTASVKAAYQAIGLPPPEILLFDSPFAAFQAIPDLVAQVERQGIEKRLKRELVMPLFYVLSTRLDAPFLYQLTQALHDPIFSVLERLDSALIHALQPYLPDRDSWSLRQYMAEWHHGRHKMGLRAWTSAVILLEFCQSLPGCNTDPDRWEILRCLVMHCPSWFFPLEDCFVLCDRPTQLHFDRDFELHAEQGQPAIEFADHHRISFYHHGILLPEKFRQLPPHQWPMTWFLEGDEKPAILAILAAELGIPTISSLTAEQEGRIADFITGWCQLAHRQSPMDRQKVTEVVEQLYHFHGEPPPEIFFCDSPVAALTLVETEWQPQLIEMVPHFWHLRLYDRLSHQIRAQLTWDVQQKLPLEGTRMPPGLPLPTEALYLQLERQFPNLQFLLRHCIRPETLTAACVRYDFCINELHCTYHSAQWQLLQSIVTYCGWMFPLAQRCLVCERVA